MSEYMMEEVADEAINDLRAFIDTEQQFVKEEHDFEAKMQQWDLVIAHLDERIPPEEEHLHKLNTEVADKLVEIRNIIESEELADLKIVKEEKKLMSKHKWKVVKKLEKKALRLEKHELKKLHSEIIKLMKIIKKSESIAMDEEHLTRSKQKHEYKKIEEYYFLQIYKFLRAYERIFRNLWKLERTMC